MYAYLEFVLTILWAWEKETHIQYIYCICQYVCERERICTCKHIYMHIFLILFRELSYISKNNSVGC